MSKKILYVNEKGGLAVIIPVDDWPGTMDELAKKDVPTGLKYKIVEASDVPTDRTFRSAWEVDEAQLTDGVGE
jgi:hypothetical protein